MNYVYYELLVTLNIFLFLKLSKSFSEASRSSFFVLIHVLEEVALVVESCLAVIALEPCQLLVNALQVAAKIRLL